ncbi:MAG TPA: cation transporter [Acidimicrobiia bacterium]|nr:cation transporter [Acidimicrobiia bacterium]
MLRASRPVAAPSRRDGHEHEHEHAAEGHRHGHSHGRVDRSIIRSRAGVRAVAISLAVLAVTAALQAAVFVLTGSIALLADLIHNGGDALTAIPLGIAFLARSERGERWSGYAVVGAIFVSALVAAFEAVQRLVHPEHLNYLPALGVAGIIGFAGNELAARVRLNAGRRLDSSALVADGRHARVDGYVSLAVVASAVAVAVGLRLADPLIGLAMTGVILRITWDAWRTVAHGDTD